MYCPTYHPQSNGAAARTAQDIKKLLKRKLQNKPKLGTVKNKIFRAI